MDGRIKNGGGVAAADKSGQMWSNGNITTTLGSYLFSTERNTSTIIFFQQVLVFTFPYDCLGSCFNSWENWFATNNIVVKRRYLFCSWFAWSDAIRFDNPVRNFCFNHTSCSKTYNTVTNNLLHFRVKCKHVPTCFGFKFRRFKYFSAESMKLNKCYRFQLS